MSDINDTFIKEYYSQWVFLETKNEVIYFKWQFCVLNQQRSYNKLISAYKYNIYIYIFNYNFIFSLPYFISLPPFIDMKATYLLWEKYYNAKGNYCRFRKLKGHKAFFLMGIKYFAFILVIQSDMLSYRDKNT